MRWSTKTFNEMLPFAIARVERGESRTAVAASLGICRKRLGRHTKHLPQADRGVRTPKDILEKAREMVARGLSQVNVATRLGLSKSTVNRHAPPIKRAAPPMTEDEKAEIFRLHVVENLKAPTIAEKVGRSETIVRRLIDPDYDARQRAYNKLVRAKERGRIVLGVHRRRQAEGKSA